MKSFLCKYMILLALLWALPPGAVAQDLKVRSFYHDPTDVVAKANPVKTPTGVDCALVKVQLPLKGVAFDREWVVGEPTYSYGEYRVYMPEGARKLIIKHDDFHTLEVDFKQYNAEHHTLKGLLVYVLVIDVPEGYVRSQGGQPLVIRDTLHVSTPYRPVEANAADSRADIPGGSTGLTPTLRPQLPKTQFYLQPEVQLGSFMSGGFSLGAFLGGFNVEGKMLIGLNKTETMYWKSAVHQQSLEDQLSALQLDFRLGYGFSVGRLFRITPQLGAGLTSLQGDVTKCSVVSGAVALRAECQFIKHFGVSLTPSYSFPLSRSEVYEKVAEVSSVAARWGGGFNASLGLFVCF